MKFVHTNIISSDWRRLADFYINTFKCIEVPPLRKQSGAWLDAGLGIKNARLEGIHLRLPGYGEHGPTLEIYQYQGYTTEKLARPDQQGFRHIAFEVDNVSNVLNKVLENGGQSQGKISTHRIEGVGTLTFVYARDPEGNLLEIQHWDRDG